MAPTDLDSASIRPAAWSRDEVDRLIELWTQGNSNDEIAVKLGRSPNSVAIKASRINLPSKNSIQRGATVLRNTTPSPFPRRNSQSKIRACLCCRGKFWSTGPGNRICDDCKDSPSWRDSGSYVVSLGAS